MLKVTQQVDGESEIQIQGCLTPEPILLVRALIKSRVEVWFLTSSLEGRVNQWGCHKLIRGHSHRPESHTLSVFYTADTALHVLSISGVFPARNQNHTRSFNWGNLTQGICFAAFWGAKGDSEVTQSSVTTGSHCAMTKARTKRDKGEGGVTSPWFGATQPELEAQYRCSHCQGHPQRQAGGAEERFLTLTSTVPGSYFYPILEMRKQTWRRWVTDPTMRKQLFGQRSFDLNPGQ